MQQYCFSHLCCCLSLFLHRGGGNINLEVRDKPLKEVFAQLEDEYGYRFIFRNDAVDPDRKVTVSMKNATIHAVLDRILDSRTEYQVRNRQITIWKAPEQAPAAEKAPVPSRDAVLKGTVRDADGEPVVGAFVQEKGTQN